MVKAALLAGAASGGGEALGLGLLVHAHWDVRAAAARVLADSGAERLLTPLMNALVSETDALARRALVDAVERLSGR
ncbi:HEAT repeat domain-containing protein [Cystobacter fuscus]